MSLSDTIVHGLSSVFLTEEQHAALPELSELIRYARNHVEAEASGGIVRKKGERRCGCHQVIEAQQKRTTEMERQLRACRAKLKYIRLALPATIPLSEYFDDNYRDNWSPADMINWIKAQLSVPESKP